MKAIVYVGASLDGFIAGQNGEIDWLAPFENDEVAARYRAFCETIDIFVIGRSTFETARSFPLWPYPKKVVVLSSTMQRLPEILSADAEVVSLPPRGLLVDLSRRGCSCVCVDGGKVVQNFLREDCIDEMIITRVPLLLGGGIPLFSDLDRQLRFSHVNSTVFSNGLVQSHYIRSRSFY